MRYSPGEPQRWEETDLGSQSAYPSITGAIFEFGFADALQQMWAAFLDELAHGRDGMRQPFHCVTPEEAAYARPVHRGAALRRRAQRRTGAAALLAHRRASLRPLAGSQSAHLQQLLEASPDGALEEGATLTGRHERGLLPRGGRR